MTYPETVVIMGLTIVIVGWLEMRFRVCKQVWRLRGQTAGRAFAAGEDNAGRRQTEHRNRRIFRLIANIKQRTAA